MPEDTHIILLEELEQIHAQETQQLIQKEKYIQSVLTKIEKRQVNIDNDYSDRVINASTLNKLSKNILKEKVDQELELIEVRELLAEGISFKLKVMELLKNIISIYDNCSLAKKNHRLKALFPDGFTVNSDISKVLTTSI